MKRVKFIISAVALIAGLLAIFFVLKSDNALLTHPKGMIAKSELKLMKTNILLMLSIILPTLIILLIVVWKYRSKSNASYEPEKPHSPFKEGILWVLPAIVVAVMAVVTWKATHKLDPYRPLDSKIQPLTIQVVALDWKWLFIYPEQGIATLNYVQIPAQTPIRFKLSADGSPMNSFWIPQLSGQIYTMTGMVTTLHIMADESGNYTGRAAEINGDGFADMVFEVKATSAANFESWVASVKRSPLKLTHSVYQELIKPSKKNPIMLFSSVEKNLFENSVTKYMTPK